MSAVSLTLGDTKSCAQTSSKVDNNINVYVTNDKPQSQNQRRRSLAISKNTTNSSSSKSMLVHGFKPGNFRNSSSDDDDCSEEELREMKQPTLTNEILLNDAEFARKVSSCVKDILLSPNPLFLRCCRIHKTIFLPFVEYAELILFIMRKYVDPDISDDDISFQIEVAQYDVDISCCKIVPHNKDDLNIYKINRIIYNQMDLMTTFSCLFTILNSEFGIESTKLVKDD